MKWLITRSMGLALAAVSLGGIASCKKQGETLKTDLGEAGYQMTTEDWFRATSANDVGAMKKFISGGFKPETPNADGETALHAAAAIGAEAAADFLLDRGISVEFRDAAARTPLMAAVIANQTPMVRWLLRQGADPLAKDKDGYISLMLAVREGSSGSVAELAPYNRENLDSALLLAALVGRADVIDSLTNYGASVYGRMEDGRTPLMIAAENGHTEAVKLLLDIGASRYTTDPEGRTAVDIAKAAGHLEIAALIAREPLPEELALESSAKIAQSMDAFVDGSQAGVDEAESEANLVKTESDSAAVSGAPSSPKSQFAKRTPSIPLSGETLSAPVSGGDPAAGVRAAAGLVFPMPPLVMRHYRERELPITVQSVQGDMATVTISGPAPKQHNVRTGETIPGSKLSVVSVRRRMEESKLSLGRPVEISVVDVRDASSGTTREWISGVSANAHDPVALVEDAATGKRYIASPGQRFKAADGSEYVVSDVRPNQMVIENASSGEVQTIPLRGPRG